MYFELVRARTPSGRFLPSGFRAAGVTSVLFLHAVFCLLRLTCVLSWWRVFYQAPSTQPVLGQPSVAPPALPAPEAPVAAPTTAQPVEGVTPPVETPRNDAMEAPQPGEVFFLQLHNTTSDEPRPLRPRNAPMTICFRGRAASGLPSR